MVQFRDLRTTLQGPRKKADAFYGKWVIRPISIYVTWLFAHLGLGPNQVTLLSLVFGLIGIAGLATGHFTAGILGLNLWYLLDHVDGEMARLRNKMSLAGTFFDTVINFSIQPFTFLGLSIGIFGQSGHSVLYYGIAAGVGSLMLLAIPMTEEAVLFNESIKGKFAYQKIGGQNLEKSQKRDLLRKSYSFLHTLVTYPSILFIMTLGYSALLIFVHEASYPSVFFYGFLIVYAFIVTFIWVSQLFYKVYFHTLDHYWKPI